MIAQNTFDQQYVFITSRKDRRREPFYCMLSILELNRKQYLLDTLSKCISFFASSTVQ